MVIAVPFVCAEANTDSQPRVARSLKTLPRWPIAGNRGNSYGDRRTRMGDFGDELGRPEDEPPWMYFYGEHWFRLQRGMAELHLQNWADAAILLAAGLESLPASYRRDRAWYGACLVRAHAGAGDAEQAEAVALRFAADIAAVNSYARGQLLGAAGKLRSIGAPQARVIRTALRDVAGGRTRFPNRAGPGSPPPRIR
jgi:hypothetical protein